MVNKTLSDIANEEERKGERLERKEERFERKGKCRGGKKGEVRKEKGMRERKG